MCFGAVLLCTKTRHSLGSRVLLVVGSNHLPFCRRHAGTRSTDTRLDGRVVLCTGRGGRRVSVALVGSLVVEFSTPLLLHQYQPAVNNKA